MNPTETTVGHVHLISAPAHDVDTLNTGIRRYKLVADKLGLTYVVLTVDKALYCKLMMLKWTPAEYQEFLFVCHGGFIP